jgi:hypothetical protein
MTADLDQLSREELIQRARELGAERPEVMTRVELRDEIVRLSEPDPALRRRSRGWLGVARDLVASVVDAGLNMPVAAAAIRGDARPAEETTGPPPVATLTLAEIYLAQGHVERALAVLDEVLGAEPEHAPALALRDRIRTERETGALRRRAPLEPEIAPFDETPSAPPAAAPFTPSSPPVAPLTPSAPPDAMRVPPRVSDFDASPATVPSSPTVDPAEALEPAPSLEPAATPAPEGVPGAFLEANAAPAPEAVRGAVLEATVAQGEAAPEPALGATPAFAAEALAPQALDGTEPLPEPPGYEPPAVMTEDVPVAAVEERGGEPAQFEIALDETAPEAVPVVPPAEPAFDLTTEAEVEPPAPQFPPEFVTEPGAPPGRMSALGLDSTPPSAPTPTLAAPSPRTLGEAITAPVCALVQKGTEVVAHYSVPFGTESPLLRVAWFVPGPHGPTEGNFDAPLEPSAGSLALPPIDASAHIRGALGSELEGAFKPLAVAWVYRIGEGGVSVVFAPPGAPPLALRAQLGRDLADLLV